MNKKRMKRITWNVKPKFWKEYKKRIEAHIGKVSADRLNKELNKEIRVIRQHFKEDNWDLDFNLIQESVVENALGPISFFVLCKLVTKGFNLKVKKDKIMICK